jgi:hypothetical protein
VRFGWRSNIELLPHCFIWNILFCECGQTDGQESEGKGKRIGYTTTIQKNTNYRKWRKRESFSFVRGVCLVFGTRVVTHCVIDFARPTLLPGRSLAHVSHFPSIFFIGRCQSHQNPSIHPSSLPKTSFLSLFSPKTPTTTNLTSYTNTQNILVLLTFLDSAKT